MGIVNVTPDSFSDGGLFLEPGRAVEQGRRLLARSRPARRWRGVDPARRARRLGGRGAPERVPAGARGAAATRGRRSRSTPPRLAVAEVALDTGAGMVNDVTALRSDPSSRRCVPRRGGASCSCTCRERHAPCRRPRPTVTSSTTSKGFLAERIEFATSEGVAEERIWIDPGIGFGKTVTTTSSSCGESASCAELGRPIVVGTSRKSFLGKLTGREVGDRLGGTIASNGWRCSAGRRCSACHDVAELRQALDVAEAILGRRAWTGPPAGIPAVEAHDNGAESPSRSSFAASPSTPITGSPRPSARSASGWRSTSTSTCPTATRS